MAADLVFEDPAEPTPTSRLATRLAPLRERPGDWARVYETKHKSNAYSFASRLREGHHRGIAAGEFEAKVGTVDQMHYVWARYVGHQNSSNGEQA